MVLSSFPQALMSLFVLASKDGWVDIMYDGLMLSVWTSR